MAAVKHSTAMSSQSVGSRLSSNSTLSRQGGDTSQLASSSDVLRSVVTHVDAGASNPRSCLSADVPQSHLPHG